MGWSIKNNPKNYEHPVKHTFRNISLKPYHLPSYIFNAFMSIAYRVSSAAILIVLTLILFNTNADAQDKEEHKERVERAKRAENNSKRENDYSGDGKPMNHRGKSTNDVKVGEIKVGRDPSEKESKKMNSYSGDTKMKSSDAGKKSSQRMSRYSGDIEIPKSRMQLPRHDSYVPIPANKAYVTSQKIKNYSGDITPKKPKAESPRQEGNYIIVNDKKGREIDRKISKYEGDIVVDHSNHRKADKERANYSGDIVVDHSKLRKADKERANYSGDIVVDGSEARVNDKRRANYQGDLPNNYLEKRAAYREDKNRKIASYNGDLSVRKLQATARKIRIKQKKMANYQGDIVVKRMKKGMHPSAVYRGGKVKNSYAAKERYRKRILKKYGKNESLEDANFMKQKYKKPKHDKKESEIWY